MFCGACGAYIAGTGSVSETSYQCSSYGKWDIDENGQRVKRCPGVAIGSRRLEEYVRDQLFANVTPEKLAEHEAREAAERAQANTRSPHADELDELNAQRANLAGMLQMGLFDGDPTERDAKMEEVRLLSDKIGRLKSKHVPEPTVHRATMLATLDLEGMWEHLTNAERNAIYHQAIDKIIVRKATGRGGRYKALDTSRLTIHWRIATPDAAPVAAQSAEEGAAA